MVGVEWVELDGLEKGIPGIYVLFQLPVHVSLLGIKLCRQRIDHEPRLDHFQRGFRLIEPIRNHQGSLGDAQGPAANPPSAPAPAPAPGDSNRGSVRRYVESIDPSSWLRRFGKVESRERR